MSYVWDRSCHMSLLGFTLLELYPLPTSLVLLVFLGRIISLQMVTTSLKKQQAFLEEAKPAQILAGREEQSQGSFPDFPSHPVASCCYLQLYPLCLSSRVSIAFIFVFTDPAMTCHNMRSQQQQERC